MALTQKRFQDLEPPLSQQTLQVLHEQGYTYLTPVQAAVISRFKVADVIVDAATGSGKTLAFIVPVVDLLRKKQLRRHEVRALIISPTRELASQIFHVAEPFFRSIDNVEPLLLVGGTDVLVDVQKITESGANVLVATPGRLLDIKERCSFLRFRELEVLVLDEADRLLEMGFERQITDILKALPYQRRTGLFSATQTQAVRELVRVGLRAPEEVRVVSGSGDKMPTNLNIKFMVCDADEKISQLAHFLLENASSKTIVYFITCASVDYWGTVLSKIDVLKDVSIVALHGKLDQRVRDKALQKFTEMQSGVLFCTDVAARGLDIPGVDWIVQYDPPQDPDMFVHRVGRTARLGRSGDAVVFLLPKEDTYVEFLRVRRIIAKEQTKPEVESVISQVRAAAMQDRDVMEKGIKAFVSFFRAYKKHHCSYIFEWKTLEFGKLAMGYGLLQLPSMPELKRNLFSSKDFVPVEGIDVNAIKYKDKSREAQRKKKLQIAASEKAAAAAAAADAAAAGADAQAKPSSKEQKQPPKDVRRLRSKKRDLKDYEQINDEYRLLKKLKKGKISETEFDKLTRSGGADDDSTEETEKPVKKVAMPKKKQFSRR